MARSSGRGSGSRVGLDLVGAPVRDADGKQAHIVAIIENKDKGAVSGFHARILLAEGHSVLVPESLLLAQDDGSYRLPFTFHALPSGETQWIFPVLQEDLHLATRTVDTGRGIRVHKSVSVCDEVIDPPLHDEDLVVERIEIGRTIAEGEPPQTRYEGDTLIVPVLEEVLVVSKKLVLKEEVRITRQRRESHHPQTVQLRREQVSIERFDKKR